MGGPDNQPRFRTLKPQRAYCTCSAGINTHNPIILATWLFRHAQHGAVTTEQFLNKYPEGDADTAN